MLIKRNKQERSRHKKIIYKHALHWHEPPTGSHVCIMFLNWSKEDSWRQWFYVPCRAPDKLRICVFYAMKPSKNACIIRSECTHYARYDNVTLSPLLFPARVTNRSHSTYGSSARRDSLWHRAFFCPNSVVSGWKN